MLHQILAKIVKQSGACNFECRALQNLPWRANVNSHQVQCNIPILRPYCEKIYTTFLNDSEILTTCDCMLWCSQIVYIRPSSLNTTTTFYFVTECSEVAVFYRFRVCACHNTSVPYLALTRVGLSVLLWMECYTKCYGLVNNSVRKVSATLLFYLQTPYEFFCCVCFYQSALCRLCVFVLCALSSFFSKGNVRYPVRTCRDPISLIVGTRFSILETQIGSLKHLNKTLDLVFVIKP